MCLRLLVLCRQRMRILPYPDPTVSGFYCIRIRNTIVLKKDTKKKIFEEKFLNIYSIKLS